MKRKKDLITIRVTEDYIINGNWSQRTDLMILAIKEQLLIDARVRFRDYIYFPGGLYIKYPYSICRWINDNVVDPITLQLDLSKLQEDSNE